MEKIVVIPEEKRNPFSVSEGQKQTRELSRTYYWLYRVRKKETCKIIPKWVTILVTV